MKKYSFKPDRNTSHKSISHNHDLYSESDKGLLMANIMAFAQGKISLKELQDTKHYLKIQDLSR